MSLKHVLSLSRSGILPSVISNPCELFPPANPISNYLTSKSLFVALILFLSALMAWHPAFFSTQPAVGGVMLHWPFLRTNVEFVQKCGTPKTDQNILFPYDPLIINHRFRLIWGASLRCSPSTGFDRHPVPCLSLWILSRWTPTILSSPTAGPSGFHRNSSTD